MNIHPENRTNYEYDMNNRIVDLEFNRADFLSRPSVMLGIVPKKDGDKWCALYGPNLMDGIAGFGDTPDAAMRDFDVAWISK